MKSFERDLATYSHRNFLLSFFILGLESNLNFEPEAHFLIGVFTPILKCFHAESCEKCILNMYVYLSKCHGWRKWAEKAPYAQIGDDLGAEGAILYGVQPLSVSFSVARFFIFCRFFYFFVVYSVQFSLASALDSNNN